MIHQRILIAILFTWITTGHALAEFQIIAGWDRQLFPSYLIGTATVKSEPFAADADQLGDPLGLIGVTVKATQVNQQVRVSITCDDFLDPSDFTCKLTEADHDYQIFPKIRYRYGRLSNCRQTTPATLTVRVQRGNSPPEESSLTVVFRSVNDCPLKVIENGEVVDTKYAFAAFVNEQHPFVDKLLREALDLRIVDRFVGYQDKDPASVIRQVYALWDLMVARDVRYSDITASSIGSDQVLSQHVRLIEETTNNSQANCVDGSVLFVSMLRKIGINASLVLEPGHCYVVFSLDPQGEQLRGLETTLIDAVLDWPEQVDELCQNAVAEDSQDEYSWPSFIESLRVASDKLATNQAKYQNRDEVDYKVINIANARKLGVLPIPFDEREQFVAYDHNSYDEGWSSDETEEGTDEDWDDDETEDEEDEEDEEDSEEEEEEE